MLLEVEEHTSEYYIVCVEQHQYSWTLGTKLVNDMWTPIDIWCEQTFGEQGAWGGTLSKWKRLGPRYFFQFEKDRAWFMLRWT